MDKTLNLGLRKPARTDKFNIDDFNYNADILDDALQGRINVLSLADYEALPDKSADTLYCINDTDGKIKLYLGDIEIKTGGSAYAGFKLSNPLLVLSNNNIIANTTTTESSITLGEDSQNDNNVSAS